MKPTTINDYRRRIDKVQAFIRQHWNKPLSLAELAAVACLSSYHFHRIYRGMMGETVIETQRRIRLQHAARRLADSHGGSITDIAFAVGYDSSQAFARAFHTEYGVAPSVYRRLRVSPSAPSITPTVGAIVMHVDVTELPDQHALCLRHVGPYHQVDTAFQQLFAWAEQHGLMTPAVNVFGISYDDPAFVPEPQLRYDACLVFDRSMADRADDASDIDYRLILGGSFAKLRHQGPYSGIERGFQYLHGQWLPHSGFETDDRPCIEHYINGPDTATPANLLTDLYLPLKG